MTLQLNHHFAVPELKCILIPFFHDVVNLSKQQVKIDLIKTKVNFKMAKTNIMRLNSI